MQNLILLVIKARFLIMTSHNLSLSKQKSYKKNDYASLVCVLGTAYMIRSSSLPCCLVSCCTQCTTSVTSWYTNNHRWWRIVSRSNHLRRWLVSCHGRNANLISCILPFQKVSCSPFDLNPTAVKTVVVNLSQQRHL